MAALHSWFIYWKINLWFHSDIRCVVMIGELDFRRAYYLVLVLLVLAYESASNLFPNARKINYLS